MSAHRHEPLGQVSAERELRCDHFSSASTIASSRASDRFGVDPTATGGVPASAFSPGGRVGAVVGDDVEAVLALNDVGHVDPIGRFGNNPKDRSSCELRSLRVDDVERHGVVSRSVAAIDSCCVFDAGRTRNSYDGVVPLLADVVNEVAPDINATAYDDMLEVGSSAGGAASRVVEHRASVTSSVAGRLITNSADAGFDRGRHD